ncbi:MAG: hypothetical protein ACD_17C00078G0006 [uncultured bacterium]|nr:MAG: hypothetical protein ACD_17C00078G0006 [uncultured bacterium]OGN56446.1 MAG: hypothetical protein A2796_03420 [Chlamydiae bacterium RIFCSPHIGHO2_01_FULL_44_39]OGN57134.1 MAG: hypothetical protein A3C42_02735 [Chlamydiae bacterium RIFCSPHIGHO2_02_FULL_45_9]OGN60162.1 MAG: hypothetical protein A3D96_04915 [Chlamydiae bacterium RIFCSPHIGHO2_12_FULL_44_59]OGN67185.1 MAG: hypothetical protein A2978_01125 [Chlamydiae bacterium RIFCSPLOWO2_01_FULL_44_52]OGN67775.1 MAG: hypothetical protein A3
MRRIFLFFPLLLSFFLTSGFSLKERMDQARPGDYIVVEANKMITILCIRSIQDQTILLEEISAPYQHLQKRPESWEDWVKNKAPGHSSWCMVEIDLNHSELLECYSFSKSAWIHLSPKESLFATLLDLPMQLVSQNGRKKIGPPPMDGEPDFRKVWNPPLIVQGKRMEGAEFDVYKTTWPNDESPLANEEVQLYFDRAKRFPLPFWIQVNTAHRVASLRAIDSGRNLPTVYRTIPRRVPEFIGLPLKTTHTLRLNLKSPKYYKTFELFAIDVTHAKKQIYPITHSLLNGEGEWKTVEIDLSELTNVLEPEHRYTWLIVPIGHSESYTETQKPFVWSP